MARGTKLDWQMGAKLEDTKPKREFNSKRRDNRNYHQPQKQVEFEKIDLSSDKALLVTDKAEEFSKKVNSEADKNLNSFTQLRRFYDEVIFLKNEYKVKKLKDNNSDFEDTYITFKMLKSKFDYAKARKVLGDMTTATFTDLIAQVEGEKKEEKFKTFCLFFEAFMGFYRQYSNK